MPANSTPRQKFDLAKQGAQKGDPAAQFLLGECYRLGSGCSSNLQTALHWFSLSASNGYHRGEFFAADVALQLHNFPVARRWYLACAKRGDAEAQFRFANLYDASFRVPQSLSLVKVHFIANYRTTRWFTPGPDGKLVIAEPLPVDYAEAAKWYKQAAAQGHIFAQNNLGVMHALGHGIRADLMEAFRLFTVAAAKAKDNAYPMDRNIDALTQNMTATQLAEAKRRAAKLPGIN